MTLNAPKTGDELTLKVRVIEGSVATRGAHWGDNLKLAVLIEDGIEGVHFGDLRLAVDNSGPWFTKGMAKALAKLQGQVDEDAPAPTTNGSDSVEEREDVNQMTVRQLRAFAGRQDPVIDLPKKINRTEALAIVKDALAERQAASAPEPVIDGDEGSDEQPETEGDQAETEEVNAAA
jgi:hypothetical protein